MPRQRRPWFRFYVEAIHDRKLRRLPPAQRWVWVVVLAMARQSPVAGYLLLASDDDKCEPLEPEDVADAAAVKPKDARAALAAFEQLGMIKQDDDLGAMFVTKWSDRQYESDDVTLRTRKHRSQERSTEPDRNVPTSSPGTLPSRAPATETDTETEPPPAPPANAQPVDNPPPELARGDEAEPNPEPVIARLEAAMPVEVSNGWRAGRSIPHARRAIADRLAAGWQPTELADAIAAPGWRGVANPAGAVAARAAVLADTEAPSVAHARRLRAEQAAAEQRDTEQRDTDERRAELDARIDALPDNERVRLAKEAAAALPIPRDPDLGIAAVRGMARSILAERGDEP